MTDETSAAALGKNYLLIQPNRKKNFGFPKCYPFPVVRDPGDETASWNCVIGHLKEHSVEVSDEKDIELIFSQVNRNEILLLYFKSSILEYLNTLEQLTINNLQGFSITHSCAILRQNGRLRVKWPFSLS